MSEQGLLGKRRRRQDPHVHVILAHPCSVVDVYSRWCGPCKAVTGLFRRIKNELGDDLLKFAIVRMKSDSPINMISLCRQRQMRSVH